MLCGFGKKNRNLANNAVMAPQPLARRPPQGQLTENGELQNSATSNKGAFAMNESANSN